MNELINKAINICRVYINQPSVTDEKLRSVIDIVCQMPDFVTIDKEALFYELSTKYNTRVGNFQILEGKERRQPWLKNYKATHAKSDWKFWNRYTQYLQEQKGFAEPIIQQNDKLTDQILDNLFDPSRTDIELSKKGLVVGQVQSGKTSNYIGLICKAADTGFNVIIVLAGIHNNLRSQTQIRIDEGFLGFDTGSDKNYEVRQTTKIGVGKIWGYENAIAHSYTTSLEKGDFTSRAANATGLNFNAPQPIILVVKKNASVLKRLFAWLKTRTNGQDKITSKSLLLIDDEADNASINTKKDVNSDPTAINNNIIQIIKVFRRSAYVGYTATPFANIFINADKKDDLFPRDFIINIPPPSNYIGPDKVFGITVNPSDDDNESVLPIVNIIDDYLGFVPEKHKKDGDKPRFEDIPESLKTAMKCFIVTCAIRELRGQEQKHNSMLIHISRYQAWQNHIKYLVEDLFNFYKHEIEANDSSIYEEFRKIYEEDSAHYCSFKSTTNKILQSSFSDLDKRIRVHSWEDVKPHLYSAVQKIEVKSINGSSGDIIDYQIYEAAGKGISVIAIGGDKLSRGLTLEGLSVSYFLRASKMYDTLMQMGRWFGYRPGYIDLCRLFTSSELNEWFKHITIASEELREEFDYMASVKATPEDYGLKVRRHPGVLQITALNKMRTAKNVEVSWGGRLVETYELSLDKGIRNKNLVVTTNFVHALGVAERKVGHYLWRNVSPDTICDFFQNFTLPQSLARVNLELIVDYIEQLVNLGELNRWSVALLNKDNPQLTYDFGNGIEIGCWNRKQSSDDKNPTTLKISKSHIVGNQKDEFVDIDSNVLDSAMIETQKIEYLKRDSQWVNLDQDEKMQKRIALDTIWESLSNEEKTSGWSKPYPSPKIVREQFRNKTNPLLMIYPLNPKYVNDSDDSGIPFIGFAISFPHTDSGVAVSYAVNQIGDFAETEENFENENDNEYDN